MKFEKIFTRADEDLLQDILGDKVIRLLSTLDETSSYNKYLRDLVINLHGYEGLLLNSKYRALLYDLLREDEARHLGKIVGVEDYSSLNQLFVNLKRKNIRRGSLAEENLFRYFELIPPIVEDKTLPESVFNANGGYSLFQHQRRAVYELKRHLSCEPYRVMLHMPTGSGKTRTAMNVIAEHFRNYEPTVVVWLANTEELCEQAVEEFSKAWGYLGDRNLNIQRFWGSHNINISNLNDSFVVAGLSKTINSIRSSDGIGFIGKLANKCSLVVMDEAHQAIAPTYKLVLDTLFYVGKENKLLGLTATPGRTWNDIDADEELANYFGKRKVKLFVEGYDSPIDYLINEGYLAAVHFESLFHNSEVLTDIDIENVSKAIDVPVKVLIKLGEDYQRNLKILYEAQTLMKKHKRILVFAPSVESSNIYACVLNARGYKAYSLTGETPNIRRKEIIDDYKSQSEDHIAICNYGILTTGFDAPQTSAALIARPTTSLVLYSQMVGRAIRGIKAGGNEVAEIVTIVDNNLPGFRDIAESFNNWEDVW